MLATIGSLLLIGLIAYTGYFRGWGWWSVAPFAALVSFILLLAMFDVNANNISGWIKMFANVILFLAPTIAMVVTGKEGRKAFAIWREGTWAWIQDKRQ